MSYARREMRLRRDYSTARDRAVLRDGLTRMHTNMSYLHGVNCLTLQHIMSSIGGLTIITLTREPLYDAFFETPQSNIIGLLNQGIKGFEVDVLMLGI